MLQTPRLYFRNYTEADFPFLEELVRDPEVVRFIGNGTPKTKEEAVTFFEWILRCYEKADCTGLMLALDKITDNAVGHIGLVPQEIDGVTEIELGYWIARQHWGEGFATEAAAGFLKHGREKLHLSRVISLIQPGNLSSIRVAQKVGMSFERDVLFKSREVSLYSYNRT